MNIDDLSVRLAKLSDKDDVMDIDSNVYDGEDYLDAYYEDFITCPLTTPYVATIYNKIVGFVATLVVDGGATVISRAARIQPSVRGRGLYKKLEAHALNLSKIKRHAFTASETDPVASKGSLNTVNKLVITRPSATFVFNARDLHSLQETNKITVVPTDEDLTAFILNDVIRSYLFPKDRIIVDWVPYRAILANIPLFRLAPQRRKILSDVSFSEEQSIRGLLTICTTFASKDPPYTSNIDIFGTYASSLRSHVVYHLRHIRKVTDGDVRLNVFVDEDFDMKELDHVFQSAALKRNDCILSQEPLQEITKLYLYEKYLI